MIPEDLRYTAEHEWVVGASGAVRVGITHFAQDALGDIVFVQLPDEGAVVAAGEPLGEIESTKSVSEIYAPLSGRVSARNEALSDTPEVINSDPYGAGWLLEITPDDPAAVDGLLTADAYRELTES
ncbi:glycine cleavage system protein GcvH [Micromonospora sp. NPDC000089]|uniref:glycine cleavage system protein GcvH n=1 Tax=unclassified Micromonospora TaxID=2617518 RepID=UPI0036B1401A